MKKQVFIALLVALSVNVCAQFAIVQDKDGYVNVRQEQSTNSKVIDRIKSNEIILPESPNDIENDVWYFTTITVPKHEVDTLHDYYNGMVPNTDSARVYGYIHGSRLVFIKDMPVVKGRYQQTKNTLSFDNGTIQLNIRLAKFDSTAHKIKMKHSEYGDWEWVSAIDGLEPYGVDGDIPRMEIKSIQLVIKGVAVKIPKRLYADLYEMNLENVKLHTFNNDIYLDMPMNSDAAGSWGAVWVIRNGKIIKSVKERLC